MKKTTTNIFIISDDSFSHILEILSGILNEKIKEDQVPDEPISDQTLFDIGYV